MIACNHCFNPLSKLGKKVLRSSALVATSNLSSLFLPNMSLTTLSSALLPAPKKILALNALLDSMTSALQDPLKTVGIIAAKSRNEKVPEFAAQSLCQVNPFWAKLPHCNIFSCFTPNVLYQLHKGVFKDHLVSWVTEACGEGGKDEIDCRFWAMTRHLGR